MGTPAPEEDRAEFDQEAADRADKEKRSSASLARLAGTAWVTESARALDASPFAVLALSELWKSTPTTIWSATAECERMSTDRSSRCAHGRARSRLIATE